VVLNYGASLTIDGAPVATNWGGGNLVGLDDATITWGREQLLEDVEPSTIHLSVIDMVGDWGTDSALQGKSIVFSRTNPDVVVFRGQITEIKITPQKVTDPDTAAQIPVWRVDLTAVDPLGGLGQTVANGPGDAISEDTQAWAADYYSARLDAVWNAGASSFLSGLSNLTGIDTDYAYLRPRMRSENLSLLDLIRDAYRQGVMAHVNYDPDAHRVSPGTSATAAGLRLQLVGGKIIATPTSGYSIPARQMELIDDGSLVAPVQSAIDLVQVSRTQRSLDDPHQFIQQWEERATTRYNASRPSRRVLKIAADTNTAGNPGEVIADAMRAKVARLATLVSQLNDRFYLPKLRYDFRRNDPGATVAAVLLAPYTTSQPFQFPGSMYQGLPNVGPSFQLIGGQIGFKSGWYMVGTFAPTGGSVPATLTLAQLVTNATPTIADFDESITLDVLGLVTQGLA
jgi:hypothetical protein